MTAHVTDSNFEHGRPRLERTRRRRFLGGVVRPLQDDRAARSRRSPNEFGGKVKIVKLNIDENQQTMMRYGVRSIPTLIIFKNGEPVDMKVGAGPKSDLQKWIQAAAA